MNQEVNPEQAQPPEDVQLDIDHESVAEAARQGVKRGMRQALHETQQHTSDQETDPAAAQSADTTDRPPNP